MIKGGPRVVTDGLVLCLDAHDAKSYAGEPTSNLIPNVANPNLSTSGWYSTGWNGNISTDTEEGALVLNATNGWRSMSYDFGVTNGTVTVQFDYKLKSAEHTNIFMIVLNGTHLGSYTQLLDNYIYPSISEYKTYKKTFTTTTDSKICIVLRGTDNAGLTDEMFVKNLQVESKSYSTPFVNGSRSATNGWVDRSGNSNSGTLTNMIGTEVTHYRDGQVIMPVANSYLDFDGSNDELRLTSYNDLRFGDSGYSDNFSIEVWFKLDTVARAPLYDYYRYGLQVGSSDGTIGLWYNGNGGTWGGSGYGGSISAGVWYHGLGVHSEGNHDTVYLNGTAVSTDSTPVDIGSSTYSWSSYPYVGHTDHVGGVFTNGQIAVVRVYNKALTAAEVLSNYNATKGRFS